MANRRFPSERTSQIILYFIVFDLLDRFPINAEFSFGVLVATISASHSGEFDAELLEALHARIGQFYDSGVELPVSGTKFDLHFAQFDWLAALKCEYSFNQEIGVGDWNHVIVCRYCEDSFHQFIEIGSAL